MDLFKVFFKSLPIFPHEHLLRGDMVHRLNVVFLVLSKTENIIEVDYH